MRGGGKEKVRRMAVAEWEDGERELFHER